MTWPTEGVPLEDVLEPLLKAADEEDEGSLDGAINDVAEALAALGVLIVDGSGQPIPGVTDERAVLGALATYGRNLAMLGRLDDALEVTELMDRIDHRQNHKGRPRTA
ncbi:hypothetical protein HL658_24590 [Azospirillum sp. RWY-5-1]|uniref:Uncharacterized protein n=1 Tax=Azospirillum oleiclasticum TaxID=2735135 RepID=A0ABX2TD68_9PROT|nr:hypothetical protein [Azospirillum oleiclasticum]NYZ15732.1 hypothetical protein [Azospirillum oleiclasticum]NYZ22002.1 hypothetical protein [Azospirillum oleiclasticum]